MKIRHVLDGQDHYAAYILRKSPYGALLKLTDRCLVQRGEVDPVDEIVGFVISDKGYRPADEVTSDTKFVGYTNEHQLRMMNKDYNLQVYLQQLIQWGQEWATRTQPIPKQVEDMFGDNPADEEEEEPQAPPKKRRGR